LLIHAADIRTLVIDAADFILDIVVATGAITAIKKACFGRLMYLLATKAAFIAGERLVKQEV
jgi:hypothetical protein